MGYGCSGSGTILIDVDAESGAAAAVTGHPQWASLVRGARTVADVLCCYYDVIDLTDEPSSAVAGKKVYEVIVNGNWDEEVIELLAVLAGQGATGVVDYTGEDGAGWKVVLAGATAKDLTAQKFYPGDPDPANPCVALTRRDAQTLLALLAGDHVDGLDAVVAKLSAAVG